MIEEIIYSFTGTSAEIKLALCFLLLVLSFYLKQVKADNSIITSLFFLAIAVFFSLTVAGERTVSKELVEKKIAGYEVAVSSCILNSSDIKEEKPVAPSFKQLIHYEQSCLELVRAAKQTSTVLEYDY